MKSVEAIPAIPIKRVGKTKALEIGMSLGVVWKHFSEAPVKDSSGKEGGNMDPIWKSQLATQWVWAYGYWERKILPTLPGSFDDLIIKLSGKTSNFILCMQKLHIHEMFKNKMVKWGIYDILR